MNYAALIEIARLANNNPAVALACNEVMAAMLAEQKPKKREPKREAPQEQHAAAA